MDRGDHLVYRAEWERFDRWQRAVASGAAEAVDFVGAEQLAADRVNAAEARVAELQAALRWYAEQRNYRYAGGDDRNAEHNEHYCRVMQDDAWLGGQPGSRARAALAGDGGGARQVKADPAVFGESNRLLGGDGGGA
jgi:hypothetical protein